MVKRDNKHIWAGIGFVFAAITIAAAVYFGMKMRPNNDGVGPDETTAVVEQAPLEELATTEPTADSSASEPVERNEPDTNRYRQKDDQLEGLDGSDTRPPTPEEEADIRRIAEEAGMTVTPHGNGFDIAPPDDE
jgi:hypothetical protein